MKHDANLEKHGKWQSTVDHHHEQVKNLQRETAHKIKEDFIERRTQIED